MGKFGAECRNIYGKVKLILLQLKIYIHVNNKALKEEDKFQIISNYVKLNPIQESKDEKKKIEGGELQGRPLTVMRGERYHVPDTAVSS